MGAKKLSVMTQDEIVMQAVEIETEEIEISEEAVEMDQVETVSNVVSLADWRKAMGYSK